jgi:putative transposase
VIPAVEKLIHRTKTNPFPKYNFTDRFYKFPSYFRRMEIAKAFGDVKSYYSKLENWENERTQVLAEGKRFTKKPPSFRVDHHAFPVFYKGNMFQRLSKNQAQIKIYKNNDWVWKTITFHDKNVKNRGIDDWKEHNPMLVRVGKKYFLHFSYSKKIPFIIYDVLFNNILQNEARFFLVFLYIPAFYMTKNFVFFCIYSSYNIVF